MNIKTKNDFKRFIEELPEKEQERLPANVKLAANSDTGGSTQIVKLGSCKFYRTSDYYLENFYKPIAIQYDFLQSK